MAEGEGREKAGRGLKNVMERHMPHRCGGADSWESKERTQYGDRREEQCSREEEVID